MDTPATVHNINELTVVTNESYTDFVAGLQKEISESLASRPRKASVKFFTGKTIQTLSGESAVEEAVVRRGDAGSCTSRSIRRRRPRGG
jgi:type III restriction enzyme